MYEEGMLLYDTFSGECQPDEGFFPMPVGYAWVDKEQSTLSIGLHPTPEWVDYAYYHCLHIKLEDILRGLMEMGIICYSLLPEREEE